LFQVTNASEEAMNDVSYPTNWTQLNQFAELGHEQAYCYIGLAQFIRTEKILA
jgi:hypothetical protein